jgi:hypothetical protein
MKVLSKRIAIVLSAVVLVASAAVVAGAIGSHTTSGTLEYSACLQARTKSLVNVVINRPVVCSAGERRISWNAAGPKGAPGAAGTNGSSIVTSAAVPSGSCTTGATNVDLVNGEVYACESSAWSDTGSSIKGPSGTPGAPGATGARGATGATGAAGTNVAAGQTCTPGQFVNGFDASGNIICAATTALVADTSETLCGGPGDYCWGGITGSGLEPGAIITFYAATPVNGSFGDSVVAVGGTYSTGAGGLGLSCGSHWTGVYAVTTTAGGASITSNVVSTPCG